MDNNQKKLTKDALGVYVIEFEERLREFLLPALEAPLGTEDYSHIPIDKIIEVLRDTYIARAKDPSLIEDESIEFPELKEDIDARFSKLNNFEDLFHRLPIIWISQFIWDNLIDDLHITGNSFADIDEDKRKRFEFVSSLIFQEEFRKNFKEPMSELMFKLRTSPRVIEIPWLRQPSPPSQCIANPEKCFTCSISGLGSKLEKIDGLTEEISKLCEIIKKDSKGFDKKRPPNPEHVSKVVQKLIEICKMAVLEDFEEEINHDSLKAEVFELAKKRIKYIYDCLGVEDDQDAGLENRDSKLEDKIPDFARLITKSLIWNRLFDDEWQYLYYIPALLHDKVPISGLVLASKEELNDSQLAMVSCTVSRLSAAFHFDIHLQQVKKHARSAAAAGILSRNMSHNIGSHVLPRIGVDALIKRIKNLLAGLPDDEYVPVLSYLRNRLDRYIQIKAEFIAETNTSPLLSTHAAMLYREVLFPLISNTALIDTIAQNEGFGYLENNSEENNYWQSTLRIKFFAMDTTNNKNRLQYIEPVYRSDTPESEEEEIFCDTVPYAMRDVAEPENEMMLAGMRNILGRFSGEGEKDKPLPTASDWTVALPGSSGAYAIYAIIENIIRNSAKHNFRRKVATDRDLQIWIGLKDTGKTNFYELEIYDTLTIGDDDYLDDIAKLLTGYLKKDIINGKGELRKSAWGIAEIMICATLLVGETDYDWNKWQTPIVDAAYLPDQLIEAGAPSEKCLVYKFRVMKARQAIFIGDDLLPNNMSGEDKSLFKKAGMTFISNIDEFTKFFFGTDNLRIGYQFAVISEKESLKLDDNARKMLPFRILIVSPKEKGNVCNEKGEKFIGESPIKTPKDDPLIVMKRIWRDWLRKWLPKDNGLDVSLLVNLGNNLEKTNFVKEWQHHSKGFNDSCSCEKQPYRLNVLPKDTDEEGGWNEKESGKRYRIIYDRHSELLPGDDASFLTDKDRYVYFDKQNPDFDRLYTPPFPPLDSDIAEHPWLFPYKLIEAGFLRVLIADERIAQRAMRLISEGTSVQGDASLVGNENMKARFWHLAERTGVLITTHIEVTKEGKGETLTLHEQSWSHALNEYRESGDKACPKLTLHLPAPTKKAEKKPENKLELEKAGKVSLTIQRDCQTRDIEESADFDVLIIHQGIIDVITKNMGVDSRHFIGNLQAHIPWIVVESGRGVPPEVKSNELKFLSFSVLDSFVTGTCVAKLGLAQSILGLSRLKQ